MRKIVLLLGVFVLAKEAFPTEIVTNEIKGVTWVYENIDMHAELLRVQLGAGCVARKTRELHLPRDMGFLSLQVVREYALSGLADIRKVVVPATVVQVERRAFAQCVDLSEVEFEEPDGNLRGLGYIGAECFLDCHKLERVKLPSGLSVLDYGAFSGCKALKAIVLPTALCTIGDYAFKNCTGLVEVMLPPNVDDVSGTSFVGCTQLKSIQAESCRDFDVVDGLLYYPKEQGLVRCPPAYVAPRLQIRPGTKRIMPMAFEGCKNVLEVTVPSSVETINAYAFAASKVGKVNLSEGVKSLSHSAFEGASLTKIEIPASVESIGFDCFKNCLNLRIVVFKGEAPKADGDFLAQSNCVLRVDKSLPSWKGKTSFGGCRIE